MVKMNVTELEELKRRLPIPIAQAMGRALEAVRPVEKMKDWRTVMDMLTGYINAIAVAEYCSLPPVAKVDKYLCVSPQQTDSGRAVIMISSIFKHLRNKEDAFCQPFIRWFYSEVSVCGKLKKTHEHLDNMVTLRNKNVHARMKGSQIEEFIEGCITLIKRCYALQEYSLILVREQEPRNHGVEGWISLLMGESPSASKQVYWSGVTLFSRGVYILDSSQECLLHLSPGLIWREDPDVRRHTLFQWRLIRKSIEYNSVLSSCSIQEALPMYKGRGESVEWLEWVNQRPLPLCIRLDHGGLEWVLDELDDPVDTEHSEDWNEEHSEESLDEEVSVPSFHWVRWVGFFFIILLMGGAWSALNSNSDTFSSKEDVVVTDEIDVRFMFGEMSIHTEVLIDGTPINVSEGVLLSPSVHEIRIEHGGFLCHESAVDFSHVTTKSHVQHIQWSCTGLLGWEWKEIPAGDFTMGADFETEVVISRSFSMLSSEVTREMWRQVYNLPLEDACLQCPQTASWYEAVDFANRLSKLEMLEPCYTNNKLKALDCEGYRLPTEAEWEYAAKAKKQQRFSGSNNPISVAHFDWNSKGHVHPVKELKVNGFGLYDMSGNVYEWCEDDYTEYLMGGVDPWIQRRGLQKVGKGGSYRSKEKSIQVENRTSADPTVSTPFIGFRLVRTIDKEL